MTTTRSVVVLAPRMTRTSQMALPFVGEGSANLDGFFRQRETSQKNRPPHLLKAETLLPAPLHRLWSW